MTLLKGLLVFLLLIAPMLKASVIIPWPEIKEIYFPYCVTEKTKFIGIEGSYKYYPQVEFSSEMFIDQIPRIPIIHSRCFYSVHQSSIKLISRSFQKDLNIFTPPINRKIKRVVYEIFEQDIENRRQRIVTVYYSLDGFILLEFDVNFWLKHFTHKMLPLFINQLRNVF